MFAANNMTKKIQQKTDSTSKINPLHCSSYFSKEKLKIELAIRSRCTVDVASCWRRRPCDGVITELTGVRWGDISVHLPVKRLRPLLFYGGVMTPLIILTETLQIRLHWSIDRGHCGPFFCLIFGLSLVANLANSQPLISH